MENSTIPLTLNDLRFMKYAAYLHDMKTLGNNATYMCVCYNFEGRV